MNDFSILRSIRRARGFSRSVAYLVIIALVGLTAERLIYYTLLKNDVIEAENPVDRIKQFNPQLAKQLKLPRSNNYSSKPQPPSNETRLSHTVLKVQDTLNDFEDKLKDTASSSELDKQIRHFREQFLALDEKAMADFDKVAQLIKDRKLPAVIQQRHEQAVALYKKEFGIFLTRLAAVEKATTLAEKRQTLQEAQKYLASKQLKRSQQPFNPNDLPNKALKPTRENRPKTSQEEFTSAGLFNTPYVMLAALGDFTYSNLAGADDPAYLSETVEITLSPAIQAKAAELNHDPVQIYRWVLNNVEWLPSWGAVQNADITLGSKHGNAMDISSLLIALLRASGIPARYVHGTIDVPEAKFRNWVGGFTLIDAASDYASAAGIPLAHIVSGGVVSKVRMEHVWVEAAIDFQPSRGAVNRDADSWTQMDPSFKQYDYLQGLDPVAISGLDPNALAQSFINSGTINETEGWVTGFDPTILENAQAQVQTALENHITTNIPNPTVGDVIGGRKTIIREYPVLPSGLPNKTVVAGARYSALPDPLQQKITFSFARDLLGYPTEPLTLPWAQLNNQKLTLSFKPATADDEAALLALLPAGEITDISQLPTSIPAYLINVIPELKLNGNIIKAGSPMSLGEEISFGFDAALANGAMVPKSYQVIAGSFLAIGVIAGSVSASKLQDLQTRLSETQTTLESADPNLINALTREDILGDMFHAGMLGYYAQYTALSYLAGLQQKAHHYLAGGLGSLGYEPNVDYFFGFPRAIEPGGIALNIPIINVAGADSLDPEARKNYVMQIGTLSSALEHAVPEQMFTDPNDSTNVPDAISAVKALAKAQAMGQRIYHLTPANQATALPNIHHDALTMSEIQTALATGKEVITHTDPVSVPGWSGAGYIILDPDTGEGAYRISGGSNGGWMVVFTIVVLVLAALLATTLVGGVLGIAFALAQLYTLYNFSTYLGKVANDSSLSTEEVIASVNERATLASISALTTLLAPFWRAGGASAQALDAFVTGILIAIGLSWSW